MEKFQNMSASELATRHQQCREVVQRAVGFHAAEKGFRPARAADLPDEVQEEIREERLLKKLLSRKQVSFHNIDTIGSICSDLQSMDGCPDLQSMMLLVLEFSYKFLKYQNT